MSRTLASIPAADRADGEFGPFATSAEIELEAAKEAIDRNRFAAAAQCLDRAEAAWKQLVQVKDQRKARENAERKAREEADRKAEAERKALEEAYTPGEKKVVSVAGMDVAFRWCPPDTFTMGSPASEDGRDGDETQHRVTLTNGFWMGETEVTQELWEKVMGKNPSGNSKGGAYPVEKVTWNDCKAFVEKLNARSDVRSAGLRFALPTEAQWEYACRAGTTGAYGGTGRLDDMGWYVSNSGSATHPVARKKANAWGLYDMHGNVYEWCADWYGTYPTRPATDPTGPASGVDRVLRGGCFWIPPRSCCSANRGRDAPDARDRSYGLRLLAFQDGK